MSVHVRFQRWITKTPNILVFVTLNSAGLCAENKEHLKRFSSHTANSRILTETRVGGQLWLEQRAAPMTVQLHQEVEDPTRHIHSFGVVL